MDLRLVVLGLGDLEISGFAISGFVAAPCFSPRNNLRIYLLCVCLTLWSKNALDFNHSSSVFSLISQLSL